MKEKRAFSYNNILTTCSDPRKDLKGFPCTWKRNNGECSWKGEKKCKPIIVHWYKTNKVDEIKELKL